jgi:hypothetical protein
VTDSATDLVAFQPLQHEALRPRLRKMSDADLLRFGRAAASLCRPEDQYGHPPRQVFVDQLREARAEWRRRYPEAPSAARTVCVKF